MTRALAPLVLVVLAGPPAFADDVGRPVPRRPPPRQPCAEVILDPAATPVRDVAADAQRGACLRRQLEVDVTAHALIDTPGFRGVLGGDLAITGRTILRGVEVSARLRAIDYVFAQNAVTKVTDTRFGPLVLGAAYAAPFADGARIAVVAAFELPYTRDAMDTIHASGQLAAVITGTLAERWRLHARMGAIWATASSAGGDTRRLALRAGFDLAWHARTRLALHAGAETQAGWYAGLDTVMSRAGVHWRPGGGAWRVPVGLGLPFGGNERTNAILVVGLARDL
jgi:hypothetical protein